MLIIKTEVRSPLGPFLLGILFFVLSASVASAMREVRVGFYDSPPLISASNGAPVGVFADILSEISKKEGLNLNYVYGTWEENLSWVKSGKLDLILAVGMSRGETGELSMNKLPVFFTWTQLFKRKDVRWGSILDLDGKRVSGCRGDLNMALFKRVASDIGIHPEYVETDSISEALQLLSEGNVAVVVAERATGRYYAKQFPVELTPLLLSPRCFAFASARGANLDLLEKIDRYLQKEKQTPNSTYWKILAQWGESEPFKIPPYVPWIFGPAISLLILSVGGNMLLKRTVRIKTHELSDRNESLEEEIAKRRKSEERTRLFFDRQLVGMAITSPDKYWLQVNDKLCQMLGYSREELTHLTWDELTHPKDLDKAVAQFNRLMAGEIDDYTQEKRFLRKDGRLVYTNLAVVCVRKEDASLDYVLALLEDITERKHAEKGLLKAKTEAEEANRTKDQFIAVLSHELRTPLTPILLSSSALETEEEVPEGIRAELGMIRRNVELEIKLIDDLLDITKINRGIVQLHPEVLDAHVCFRNALRICQSEIEAKHLNVSLMLGADRTHVWADPARLQQAFWNLLRNAVKFTPANGAITIRSTNVEDRLLMEFSDTGIGINPAALPRIFNAFEQTDQSKTRRFGGLGLGLSIAKTVVDLHGGTLTAFSEGTDKGATFKLQMPTIPDPKMPTAAPLPPHTASSSSQTILLVEDHMDTLQAFVKTLHQWGYIVKTAKCVRDALEKAAKEPFDLLVSDLGLPDGSGLEIMQQIKRLYGVKGVAISGFGTNEDIRQSLAAGFDEHLVKPVNIPALRAAIQRITSKGTH